MHFKIPKELFLFCQSSLQNNNLGNRNTNTNGNSKHQLFGLIAENIVRDFMGYERNDASGGFDGGWDLIYQYKRYDVKTSLYNEQPQQYHRYDVPIMQLKYISQGYIFTNYNEETEVVSIVGTITKENFLLKSEVINKGQLVSEPNGKTFRARYISHFVRAEHLQPFNKN